MRQDEHGAPLVAANGAPYVAVLLGVVAVAALKVRAPCKATRRRGTITVSWGVGGNASMFPRVNDALRRGLAVEPEEHREQDIAPLRGCQRARA